MVKIKRLRTVEELQKFVAAFTKQIEYEIPLNYFMDEEVWVLLQDHKIVGGFAFVHKTVPRSLQQIPRIVMGKENILYFPKIYIPRKEAAEITGYWLEQKKGALLFTLWFVIRAFLHPAKYFFYSYPVSQKKLGYYYSKANPLIVYRGVPSKLPGHSDHMEAESVECITAMGVLKIFLHRVWKYIKKALV